jgi:hypothetical protein
VAGVGDERALAGERRVQPGQHPVERDAEPGDLVLGGRHRQPPLGLAGGQLRRAPAHPLDRAQRRGGDRVAGERGDQQRQRAADGEQGVQPLERRLALLERLADDDHGPVAGVLRRPREHADAVGRPRPGRQVPHEVGVLRARHLGRR